MKWLVVALLLFAVPSFAGEIKQEEQKPVEQVCMERVLLAYRDVGQCMGIVPPNMVSVSGNATGIAAVSPDAIMHIPGASHAVAVK